MQDTGCRLSVSNYRLLVVGDLLLGVEGCRFKVEVCMVNVKRSNGLGCRLQVEGCRLQVADFRFQTEVEDCLIQITGYWL